MSDPDSLTLRRLGEDEEQVVDHVLRRLATYSRAVDGVPYRQDGARYFLTALPPGMPSSAKYGFAILRGKRPIGLIDLIDGYPRPGVGFLGLLAIVEGMQRRGFGRQGYALLERFARSRLKEDTLRLAVVASNPVQGFWWKMGFRETGEVGEHRGEALAAKAILMQKGLD